MISRRDFLKLMGLAGGASVTGVSFGAAPIASIPGVKEDKIVTSRPSVLDPPINLDMKGIRSWSISQTRPDTISVVGGEFINVDNGNVEAVLEFETIDEEMIRELQAYSLHQHLYKVDLPVRGDGHFAAVEGCINSLQISACVDDVTVCAVEMKLTGDVVFQGV